MIELELTDESSSFDRDAISDALADVIGDMRFLGMQPTVFFPHEFSDPSLAHGQALTEMPALGAPVLDYPGLR